MIRTIFFFLFLPVVLFSQIPATPTEGLILINLFDASINDSIACYRIPALATAPNGHLIAAIDERVPSCGDLKWSKDINIVIRRSLDFGKTWLPIERIVDLPYGQSASDPSIIIDEVTNEIFLFYNFMDLEKEKDVYYFHVISSIDNGRTWSEPKDITSQFTKPEWHQDFKFITSGRGIQTKAGKLLHCLVNIEKGAHVFGSDDHGVSWHLIDHPLIPGDESKIVELDNGHWMVNSRIKDDGNRHVHVSEDLGATWRSYSDKGLIDPGCNASILKINNKASKHLEVLLFSNANHPNKRENMTVHASLDGGKSWPIQKTIYTGSSAYSSLTEMKNGDIGLFFEKDQYQQNVFVSFSMEWLLGEK